MNTDTEKNINEAIDWLQQVGGSVQDFAVEQAPLYCREVVAWQLWTGVVVVALGFVPILVAILAWKHGAKLKKAEQERDCYSLAMPELPFELITLFALIGSIVSIMTGTPKAIKAAVAPRLVIVEHLRGLKP